MRVKKKRDTLEQSYSLYISDTPNPVSKKVYKKIVYAFNKEIARLMIEEGVVWKMPNKIGKLGILRRKMKFHKPKFDYQHWKLTGEKSFFLNEHTKEWYAYCHWTKKDCRVMGKNSYKFTMTRDNKRALAKQMMIEDEYIKYELAPVNKIKKK